MKLNALYFNEAGRVATVVLELPAPQVTFLQEHSRELGFDLYEVDEAVTLTIEEAAAVSAYVGRLSAVTSPNYEVTSAIFNFFDYVVSTICQYADDVLESWQEG